MENKLSIKDLTKNNNYYKKSLTSKCYYELLIKIPLQEDYKASTKFFAHLSQVMATLNLMCITTGEERQWVITDIPPFDLFEVTETLVEEDIILSINEIKKVTRRVKDVDCDINLFKEFLNSERYNHAIRNHSLL